MLKIIVGVLIVGLFIGNGAISSFIVNENVESDTNLVAYWNFDEGSGNTVHDNSGNGYDGTNVGGTWVDGKFGYGLEITDTDYVGSIPNSYDNTITTGLTIAAWVSWYGPSGYGRSEIFDGRYSSGNGIQFNIYTSGKLHFYIHQVSSLQSITSVPSSGSWTHVAATFNDTSDLMKVYINGQPDGTLTTTVTYTNSGATPFIGNNHWAPGDSNWVPFNGVIDDLRIYNKALTDLDIQNLYAQGGTNNPPNPPNTPNPSSGATDVDVNAELSWSCSDPDGNPLTYDVYFGINPIPTLISSNQTGNTYKPATMSYLTPYYWKIVAKDNHGATTNGSIWSFTTTDQLNNPPDIPSRPSGPAAGWTGTLITFSTVTADPDFDQVKYGWDWNGNDKVDQWTTLMPSNITCNIKHTWNNPGIYKIKVKVKDSKGAVSGWSNSWKVTISFLNHDPNKPSRPNGPTNGEVDIEYSYQTSSTDPDDNNLEYYWDLDGDFIADRLFGWFPSGEEADVGIIFEEPGEYNIRVKAEDTEGGQSYWSDPLAVYIEESQNQRPIINIISPQEDDFVTGILIIYGMASDIDGNETLTQVEVRIDDKPWQNAIGLELWNYSWNTVNETSGPHTIRARSFDGELYSSDFVVNVTVQHDLNNIIVSNIKGGFCIKADIKNIGSALAYNVSWIIDVEADFGIILSGEHTYNVIDELGVNDPHTIQSDNLRGIGFITITVQAADASKTAKAFLLGPLILRVKEI